VKSVAILRLFFFRDKVKFQSQIVMEQSNQTEICKKFFELFLKGQKFGSTENFQNGFQKKIIFEGKKFTFLKKTHAQIQILFY
jgi:hypothetical protein